MATVVGIVALGLMLFCVGCYASCLLYATLTERESIRRVSPYG